MIIMADLFCCWEKHLVFQSCVPYVRFLCLKKIIIIISISLQVSGILNKKLGTVSVMSHVFPFFSDWARADLTFLKFNVRKRQTFCTRSFHSTYFKLFLFVDDLLACFTLGQVNDLPKRIRKKPGQVFILLVFVKQKNERFFSNRENACNKSSTVRAEQFNIHWDLNIFFSQTIVANG